MGLEEARLALLECPNAKDMLMKTFGMEQKHRLLVIALIWQWWTARNKTNAGERSWSVDEVSFQARRWATEFTEFYAKQLQQQPNEDVERWRPPREGVLKINVDGAFKENPKSGGWGFVIRGQNAEVLGSGAGCLMFPQSPLHAEAEACIQGLTTAMNWGMTRVKAASDKSSLVALKRTIGASLDLVDPLAGDGTNRGRSDNIPSASTLKSSNLLSHR
ncbi:uncharacterized protein [Lolium perenne]|uniref:uncharacterized protein n=1 Tax=Lolium perenne TaxID=4522 RepID=UPI0021F5E4AE|nr:uncharacterized protein LOC127310581 [Lolium perenne]